VATRRPVLAVLTAAGLLVSGLAAASPASASVTTSERPVTRTADRTATGTLTVGSLVLSPCNDVLPGAYCGHLAQPWDPSGLRRGTISVGFAFLPASDRSQPVLGTVVPNEGGPGFSTTDSATLYAPMYGPLLTRRNLLLVDQRGTGLTSVIDCPTLENLVGPYNVAAIPCAKKLGSRSDLYGTPLSADDLSAVIRALDLGKVDLYGDSYGTFFAQVFAGRHGDQLRSIILDSSYPPTGETAWYPTQTAAMTSSLDKACARTPACASVGGPTPTQLLAQVLAQVRKAPYTGIGYDADGVRHHVVVDGKVLVSLAFGATYGPAFYREIPAALRSALAGNRAPLIRLAAEADYATSASDLRDYSEGMDAATSCQDYPQLYDMTATPAERLVEYKASVAAEEKADPGVYAPFTIAEYLASDWEEADWCLNWPVASSAHPAGPPAPPSGHYPSVPTMVLSGELDSITTPAEAELSAQEFPGAVHVIIANSFHVTAEGDADGCGQSILRAFVADPVGGLTPSVLACAPLVPPVRAVGTYVSSFLAVPGATAWAGSSVSADGLRAAAATADTVADVLDRWSNNYSGVGVGLAGGTWWYDGDAVTTFHLTNVRLTKDLAVSGTVVWARFGHTVKVDLVVKEVTPAGALVRGGVNGTISGSWNTRAVGAVAVLSGTLGGKTLRASLLAP
jgi:pimeloyl-ACP methyl ester carboxylesterase